MMCCLVRILNETQSKYVSDFNEATISGILSITLYILKLKWHIDQRTKMLLFTSTQNRIADNRIRRVKSKSNSRSTLFGVRHLFSYLFSDFWFFQRYFLYRCSLSEFPNAPIQSNRCQQAPKLLNCIQFQNNQLIHIQFLITMFFFFPV